jgi:predicted permease
MDHRILGYLIAISIGTGILFGLAPALRLSKLDVNASLKEGGRGAHGSGAGGGRTRHLSSVLVIAEMALAVVLLAGAGVMIRSFLKIHNAEMGVNTSNVLVAALDLPAARYPSRVERISFYDRLQTRLQTLPGVKSVAFADALPSNGPGRRPFEIAGISQNSEQRPVMSPLTISPSYFRTMGASLLAGREFNDADGVSGVPVVLVNQKFVSQYLHGEDPVGKRLRFFRGTTPEDWLTIVGVVSNIVQNDTNRQRFDPVAYVPFRQNPNGDPWILARTSISSGSQAAALRQEVQALDSGVPIYGPYTLADRLERYWDSRFYGGLFLIFAAIALLLASIGLYTVIAHSVTQRTQEIGIRMAIGGTPRDIRKLVFMQGMLPVGIGLAIGLAASFAVNRLLKSMLVQVSPADPITLMVAAAVLILAALLGCLIPARRAMRVDPVVALRNE